MKFYDVDGSGTISYMEFSRGMRDELTERRLAMTKKAFNMMDKDGSGVVTKADLMGIYDVSRNPQFLNQEKTKEEILDEFLKNFEGGNHKEGNSEEITWEDWYDHYQDVSMSCPTDDYYV
jgi:Ca2+-binding EF-hand superfamily protein